MKTSNSNVSLPILYVLNNLELPEYSVDLSELFGSEDNFRKALVGKWDARNRKFASITWDWPISNFRHILNIAYFLSCLQQGRPYLQDEFDSFYKSGIDESLDLIDLLTRAGLPRPIRCLYVMIYRKQFPALLIEWEKILRERGRKRPLLITFVPTRYFMMDPITWNEVKERSKNLKEWVKTYKIPISRMSEFSRIFAKYINMKQHTYGFLLKNILYEGMRRSKVLFTKPVEPSSKVKVVSDNLVFWELLYYFTGASRTKYDVKLDTRYLIRHIPIDALDVRSSVYKHEAGVANVLSHVLVELFGDKYFTAEFDGKNEISYREATIFRREFQVRNIAGEGDNEFADTDYDFALTLHPLRINKTILIDLTTALWKKGLFSYEDYIKRWKETCFNIPSKHPEIRLLWYILINETEEKFFNGPPPNPMHKNFDEMLRDLSAGCQGRVRVVSDEQDLATLADERITIVKVFRKSPTAKNSEMELENLLGNYRNTLFYKTCFNAIKN